MEPTFSAITRLVLNVSKLQHFVGDKVFESSAGIAFAVLSRAHAITDPVAVQGMAM